MSFLNQYPAWCEYCSRVQPARHGKLVQSRGSRARWVVRCNGVTRSVVAPAPVQVAALVQAVAPPVVVSTSALGTVAADAVERVRAAEAAAAATVERQRAASSWMEAFATDPVMQAEREAAVAARREQARAVAERNRTLSPVLYRAARGVCPQIGADGSVRGGGLELDEIQVEPETPNPVARWAGLELD
jgi:hypothetical protein